MDKDAPIDGDAVVNHLLGRIADLERELALAIGALGAAEKALRVDTSALFSTDSK